MERLLQLLKGRSDQAEIFALETRSDLIRLENGRLKSIASGIQSGVSIRLIRNRRLGFAYTRNLRDPEGLIRHAEASLADEMPAGFSFPAPVALPELKTYNPDIDRITNRDLTAECERISNFLCRRTSGQVNVAAARFCQTIRLMNTLGLSVETQSSQYYCLVSLLFPGSYAAIERGVQGTTFKPLTDVDLDFLVRFYGEAQPTVTTKTGSLPAVFLPDTLYVLIWRLQAGASGRNAHLGESRLTNQIGQTIIDPKLTIFDDSRDDNYPMARAFDDEGTPTRRLNIVENGVFKSFFYDLEFSQRAGAKPTGHGYRSSSWSGDPVSTKPEPVLEHLFIAPGDMSLERMIGSLDRGVIIAGALGGHSGNIPNGDFSIGLSPGIYVENGKITGRLINAMVAGNAYETLRRVRGIGDTLYPTPSGNLPALLVDEVHLSV